MPEFSLLPEETRLDMVEYVRWLGAKGEFEQLTLDLAWEDEELPGHRRAGRDRARALAPRGPARDLPGRARGARTTPSRSPAGEALFNDIEGANCAACHGPRGAGDGPTADSYLDDWGYPIRPRNLQLGVFRAGQESVDLYRTIAAGIKGSPMPSYAGAMSAEQIWDMVHFIQSLSDGEGGPQVNPDHHRRQRRARRVRAGASKHLAAAGIALLLSMSAGFLYSLQFLGYYPFPGSQALAPGHMRLIHTNLAAYGWLVNGFTAMMYFVVPRLTGKRVLSGKLGNC